jgi:hypothetical protein
MSTPLPTRSPGPSLSPKEDQRKKFTIWVGFAALVILIITGTLIGWILRVKHFVGEGMVLPGSTQGRELDLMMDIISVDPIAGTISIIWRIQGDSCNTNCSDVNIFFDPNLQINNNPPSAPPSTDPPTSPIFRWSPSSRLNRHAGYPIFHITSLVVSSGLGSPNLQDYPFDTYGAPINLFAVDANTSAPVGFSIVHTGGIAVGFSVTSTNLTGCGDADDPPGEVCTEIKINRGVLVKAYAIIIVIAVWIITLIFVFTTCYSVLGGFPQRPELLVIPVATLFTVTQLRTTMPGAPNGFGAIIDYVALLPCLAMMTLCGSTSITLLAFPELLRGGGFIKPASLLGNESK